MDRDINSSIVCPSLLREFSVVNQAAAERNQFDRNWFPRGGEKRKLGGGKVQPTDGTIRSGLLFARILWLSVDCSLLFLFSCSSVMDRWLFPEAASARSRGARHDLFSGRSPRSSFKFPVSSSVSPSSFASSGFLSLLDSFAPTYKIVSHRSFPQVRPAPCPASRSPPLGRIPCPSRLSAGYNLAKYPCIYSYLSTVTSNVHSTLQITRSTLVTGFAEIS